MTLIRRSQPITEPITLDDAKQHLRVLHDDEDRDIAEKISEARDYVEQYCDRIFAAAEFALLLDVFDSAIALPRDTTAVTSVTYQDSDGIRQAVTDTDYVVDLDRGTLSPVSSWPSGTAVNVELHAGPDLASSPPEYPPRSVIAAIKLVLTDLYENRGAAMVAVSRVDNPAVERLLHFYRSGLGV